jgi:hypothetical protein
MNIAPLFPEREKAANLWNESIHWWLDPTIKVRFVEINTSSDYNSDEKKVWFIMAAESKKPDTNIAFYKILPRSEHYERFKKGHGGEAYVRLGIYEKKRKKDVKDDALCDCGHAKEDHEEEEDNDDCLYEDCNCTKFESLKLTLLKKKKVVTDIKFLAEDAVKDDALAWNCLYINKYKAQERE